MEKICKNCGEKNADTAKFCKKCGVELDIHPSIVKSNSSNSDDQSKKIIIALIAIAAILAIAIGVYASGIMDNHDATSENVGNSQPASDTNSVKTAEQSSSSAPSSQSMSILGGSFSTGSAMSDKTYAKIYVGPSHAGELVTVQIWYSRDGNTLNHGNMVPAHVDSSGYLSISSADAYKYYPDYATINLYDSSGSTLLDSVSVNLSPTSGTQTF